MLTGFLNALGFRKLCEDLFSKFVPSMAVHRPGKIFGSLAVMFAAGGEQVSDVDQLRAAPALFGTVAPKATVSRFMARVKDQPEAFAHGFATMQRTLRSKVWAAAGKRNPGRRATAADPLIIDLDASLVHVHSDKELAKGTYKGEYGLSPLIAIVDYGQDNGTGEILAVLMRPGNKGANSARDHIEMLTRALAQLPDDVYDSHGNLLGEKILTRTDSAGASREFLKHLPSLGIQFFDARHRARGSAKTGSRPSITQALASSPCFSFAANEAWTNLAMFAMNLIAWIQLSILPSGHVAGVWDVKRWRYRLFSMAGKLVRDGRQTRLLLPRGDARGGTGHGPAPAHHPRPPALQAREPGRLNRRPEPSTARRTTKTPGSGTRCHRPATRPSLACPKTARPPTPHQNTESAASRQLMKQLG